VAADLDFLLADFLIEVWDGLGGVLRADCMWARLCPQIKVPAINSAHIKLIDLRVDTLHVAADLDFLLADFSTEVWDGLGGVLQGRMHMSTRMPSNSSPTLPFLTSAHIKLIGLRDTLHVATDPTFIAFTPFTLEIY
jgi:hypothetical protein